MAVEWEDEGCPHCKEKFQRKKGADHCTCPACGTPVRVQYAENAQMVKIDESPAMDSGLGCVALLALIAVLLYVLEQASLRP